jgi:hypothetical protein
MAIKIIEKKNFERPADKFSVIREMFNVIDVAFPLHFFAGRDTLVGKIISLFRGKCSFKVFMKEKPGKYPDSHTY